MIGYSVTPDLGRRGGAALSVAIRCRLVPLCILAPIGSASTMVDTPSLWSNFHNTSVPQTTLSPLRNGSVDRRLDGDIRVLLTAALSSHSRAPDVRLADVAVCEVCDLVVWVLPDTVVC